MVIRRSSFARFFPPLLAGAALFVAAGVQASEPNAPIEARVEALEDSVELLNAMGQDAAPPATPAPARAAKPAHGTGLKTAFVLDTAVAAFRGEPMQVGAHDPSITGFHLQQLEMSIAQNVDHLFELKANLVFSAFGVEVEEAYGRTTALPGRLQLKFGQFLTRMGRLNPTHPHAWSFLDQPLVNGFFLGPEGSRGAGIEGSWLLPTPWFLEALVSASDPSGDCCARSFMAGSGLGMEGFADPLVTMGLRQFFDLSTATGLAWGLSAQVGPNATGNGNRSEIYATDIYLRWRPPADPSRQALSLTIEAMLRRRQVPGDLLEDAGGYAQLVWTINRRWETGARVDLVLADPSDTDSLAGERQRAAAQLTYRPSHFSRLRLQGSSGRSPERDQPVLAGMLGVELLIGAHGAHKY